MSLTVLVPVLSSFTALVVLPVTAFSVAVGLVTVLENAGVSFRGATVAPSVVAVDQVLVLLLASVASSAKFWLVAAVCAESATRTERPPVGVPL